MCSKNTDRLSQIGDDVLRFHVQHVHLDWRKDSCGSTGMSLAFLSTETIRVGSDDVWCFRLQSLQELHSRHKMDLTRVTDELASTKAEREHLETEQPVLAQKFRFYQELRGYVTDLVECLDEKVGSYISFTTGGETQGVWTPGSHILNRTSTMRSEFCGWGLRFWKQGWKFESSGMWCCVIGHVVPEGWEYLGVQCAVGQKTAAWRWSWGHYGL
jgi:hypothetical protein